MLTPGFVLHVVGLKRCGCPCHNLRLGVGFVKEGLVLDEHKLDGDGAMDNAHVGLSIPESRRGYSVVSSSNNVSFVEAQQPQSRGSKVANGTFLGGAGGEIEVAM